MTPMTSRLSRPAARLPAMAIGHALVDSFANMPVPLIALYFQEKYALSDVGAASILAVMAGCTSLFQPVWGYLSERVDTRMLLPWMPLAAGVMTTAAILAPNWPATLVLVGVSGLFVAAFHPEGARVAGQSWPARRNLAMAVFLLGGTLGLSGGPLAITYIIGSGHPKYTVILLVPPLIAGLLLTPMVSADRTRTVRTTRFSLTEAIRGRRRVMAMLLLISTGRAFVVVGVLVALNFLMKQRGADLIETGHWVSLFVFSGGIGMVVCSALIRRRAEKITMVVTLLAAAPVLAIFPYTRGIWAPVTLAAAGALLHATMSVTVAMAQRVLPAGIGVASGAMIGLSWGIGGMIAPLVAAWFSDKELAIVAFACPLVVPAALSTLLPQMVMHEPTGGEERSKGAEE